MMPHGVINLPPPQGVGGRLQIIRFRRAWWKITRDPWIRKLILRGVTVNLRSRPHQEKEPREKSWENPLEKELEWLDAALSWRAIERVPEERVGEKGEILHNLISEMKKGRLCSNTRLLNLLVKKMRLKMESIKDIRQRMKADSWMLSIDLSKFYWSTMISPAHRKYFRFRMNGELWQWRVLPFGFKNAMQIMARLMAPVIQRLEKLGIEVIIWVDDMILLLGTGYELALERAQKAIDFLVSLGFSINITKTKDHLTKEVKFRGFMWSTETMEVWAPEDKLADIRAAAKGVNLHRSPIRALATLIGKVRYITQIHIHILGWLVECQIFLKTFIKEKGWDGWVRRFPETVAQEILHFRQRTTVLRVPMRPSEDPTLIETMGDAGPLGFGFEGFQPIAGVWSLRETLESTNWRELKTWDNQVLYYEEQLSDRVSVYSTDSVSGASYIRKGYGKIPALARMVACVLRFMEPRKIFQFAKVVDQETIKSSDILSRLRDKEEVVTTRPAYVRWTNKARFIPTVDLFSSRFSAKEDRYYSRVPDDQALGTNAFSHVWRGEKIFAFPPATLIHRTLTKIESEQCDSLLVIPDKPLESWHRRAIKMMQYSFKAREGELRDIHDRIILDSRWRVFRILGTQ
jgi:hypothetical protein